MPHPSNLAIYEQAKVLAMRLFEPYEGLFSGVRGRYVSVKASAPGSTPIYAYRDNAGVVTIGWGTTHYENGKAVQMSDVITKSRADQLKIWEVGEKGKSILKLIDVPVTPYVMAACISAAYNTGAGGPNTTRGFYNSNLRRVINNGGDSKTIYNAILFYVPTVNGRLDRGVVKRRLGEARFSLAIPDFYIEVGTKAYNAHWNFMVANYKKK